MDATWPPVPVLVLGAVVWVYLLVVAPVLYGVLRWREHRRTVARVAAQGRVTERAEETRVGE